MTVSVGHNLAVNNKVIADFLLGFARYLNVVDGIRIDVIPEFIKQMRRIERWFMNQKQLHFFSSSLLFVYEGATSSATTTMTPSQPVTQESDILSNSHPNFVSYSHLKRSVPKSKPSAPAVESLPINSNISLEKEVVPGEENGFVNRLPTYQESIAAKLGHRAVSLEGGVRNGAEGSVSVKGGTQPQLLDINGRLTVSQMRERQKSLSQSNGEPNIPPLPSQSESSELAMADENIAKEINNFEPIEVAVIPMDPGKESDSKLAIVKMIDFTHVVEADTTDESYLFGLRNVIQFFEMLNNFYGKE